MNNFQEYDILALTLITSCFLLFVGVMGQRPAWGQDVDIPTSAQLQQLPLADHPRLMLTEERLATLKQQIDTNKRLGEWYQTVKAKANDYLEGRLPRYVIADGLRLLSVSRRVLEHVRTLAFVYLIEGDEKYARRAWTELQAAASFPNWNPKHFLDVAEMTLAFAIGYDWLYDYWTAEQKDTLEKAIAQYGLNPAMAGYRGTLPHTSGWMEFRKNWNWIHVVNGGIGTGALAVMEVYPQLAGNVLHEALRRMVPAIKSYAPDGAWPEGPSYWNYATRYTTYILSSLNTAYGTDFGLSGLPGFSETGWFPIYMTSPIGKAFNFADSGIGPVRGGCLFWLADRFDEPAFAIYQKQVARPSVMNLVWFQPGFAKLQPSSASWPLDRYYKGIEVATFRSVWDNPEALFVGFKAGDNKAPHSNLDLGSFVFDALGVRWAMELGSDDYNLPGYFGSRRWTYYRMRPEGQNTLVIEPGMEPSQDPKAVAEIVRFESRRERAFAIANLTRAYGKEIQRVYRGIMLLEGRRQVLVQDEIRAVEPVEVWWFMHTRAAIEVGDTGTTALLRRDGKRLWVKLLAPAGERFEVMLARPLPSSPHPEGQAENEGIRKLAIHLKGVTDERVAVLLVLLQEGQTPPEILPSVQPLTDW